VEAGNLIILESTSPVGTTEKVKGWVEAELTRLGRNVDGLLYAHCPERILPGQMLKELVSNDRICGGLTPAAAAQARDLYATFCSAQIFLTDARTAELAKLTENAFRDVNIAFANELSLICDKLGVDVWELIRLANRHPRVKILQPGPGVGGHCIAVDPWFIVDAAPAEARLLRTAREVNDSKPHHVVAQVRAAAGPGAVVACLGLAFKANIDDLRESPAVEIAAHLADAGLKVLAVEPHVATLPKALQGRAELVPLRRRARPCRRRRPSRRPSCLRRSHPRPAEGEEIDRYAGSRAGLKCKGRNILGSQVSALRSLVQVIGCGHRCRIPNAYAPT